MLSFVELVFINKAKVMFKVAQVEMINANTIDAFLKKCLTWMKDL